MGTLQLQEPPHHKRLVPLSESKKATDGCKTTDKPAPVRFFCGLRAPIRLRIVEAKQGAQKTELNMFEDAIESTGI